MRRFQKEHGRDQLCATYWAAPHTQRLYNVREPELGSACVGGHLGRPGAPVIENDGNF
jgi:hypothetical protein